jgi:RNA polymerase sigma factor (sigma-70 family)
VDIANLYAKHADWVYRKCLRYTKCEEDARDLVQEVFMELQKAASSFRRECAPFTLLYRITVNRCYMHLRKRYRHDDHFVLFDESDGTGSQRTFNQHSSIDLKKILNKINPTTRLILFLHTVEGLTQEETAEVMNMSRRALNKRLSRLKSDLNYLREAF